MYYYIQDCKKELRAVQVLVFCMSYPFTRTKLLHYIELINLASDAFVQLFQVLLEMPLFFILQVIPVN